MHKPHGIGFAVSELITLHSTIEKVFRLKADRLKVGREGTCFLNFIVIVIVIVFFLPSS